MIEMVPITPLYRMIRDKRDDASSNYKVMHFHPFDQRSQSLILKI